MTEIYFYRLSSRALKVRLTLHEFKIKLKFPAQFCNAMTCMTHAMMNNHSHKSPHGPFACPGLCFNGADAHAQRLLPIIGTLPQLPSQLGPQRTEERREGKECVSTGK